jgi:hypothetical protein
MCLAIVLHQLEQMADLNGIRAPLVTDATFMNGLKLFLADRVQVDQEQFSFVFCS